MRSKRRTKTDAFLVKQGYLTEKDNVTEWTAQAIKRLTSKPLESCSRGPAGYRDCEGYGTLIN
jgi:hypothetical protein